jgi:phosphoglycolate phosphatase-like HAD superfamily hydrolase
MVKPVIFEVDRVLADANGLYAASSAETFRHAVTQAAERDQVGRGSDQFMPAFLPRDMAEQRDKEIAADHTLLFQRLRMVGQRIILATSARGKEPARYWGILGVSDDTEHFEPAPDIVQAALGRLASLPADAAIMVGDTLHDAAAAGKTGLLSDGFLEVGCIALYRDPANLLVQAGRSPLVPA